MRKYLWPFILIIKLLASKFYLLKKILLTLGFFSPGPRSNSDTDRFLNTFEKYYEDAHQYTPIKQIKSVCELGPGGTDFAQLAAAINNVEKFDQIDVISLRRSFLDCGRKYFNISDTVFSYARHAKLRNNYNYYDNGAKSLNRLSAESYELIFSHSVMQHIFVDNVEHVVNELFRIGCNGSIHIHYIDLLDCFSGGKNHFRFSNKLWHSKLIQNAGFYTNRIYADLWVEIFLKNGFELIEYEIEMNNNIKLSKRALHEDCVPFIQGDRLKQSRLIVKLRK